MEKSHPTRPLCLTALQPSSLEAFQHPTGERYFYFGINFVKLTTQKSYSPRLQTKMNSSGSEQELASAGASTYHDQVSAYVGFDYRTLSAKQMADFIIFGMKRNSFIERIGPMISKMCRGKRSKDIEELAARFQRAAEQEVLAMFRAIGAVPNDGAEVNVLDGDAKEVFDLPAIMIKFLKMELRAALAREAEVETEKAERKEAKAREDEAKAGKTANIRNEQDRELAAKVNIKTDVTGWPEIPTPPTSLTGVAISGLVDAYTIAGSWSALPPDSQDFSLKNEKSIKSAVETLSGFKADAAKMAFAAKIREFEGAVQPLAVVLRCRNDPTSVMEALEETAAPMALVSTRKVLTEKAKNIKRTMEEKILPRRQQEERNAAFVEQGTRLLKEMENEKKRIADEAAAEAESAAAAEAEIAAATPEDSEESGADEGSSSVLSSDEESEADEGSESSDEDSDGEMMVNEEADRLLKAIKLAESNKRKGATQDAKGVKNARPAKETKPAAAETAANKAKLAKEQKGAAAGSAEAKPAPKKAKTAAAKPAAAKPAAAKPAAKQEFEFPDF